MTNFLLVLVGIGLVATLATLFVGVFSMGRGGEFNKRNSNKLMRLRVILQGCTIAAFVLYLLARQG
ncbi:MAG: twin transmembrane helix small protein [Rhodospirillaceae bacterium]|nr:twin transmembrane helix small protein [Rhodospirillaceae bacterium]